MEETTSVTDTKLDIPEETLAYFIIDNHPCSGTHIKSERVLNDVVSSALLGRLKELVAKDLLAVQKLRVLRETTVPLLHSSTSSVTNDSNSSNIYNNSNNSNNNNNHSVNGSLNSTMAPPRSKLTFLPDLALAIVSLFFEYPPPTELEGGIDTLPIPLLPHHAAVSLIIGAPANSPRLHLIFPSLRDRLRLTWDILLRLNPIRSPLHAWGQHLPVLSTHLNGWLRAGIAWGALGVRETVLPALPPEHRAWAHLAGVVSAALEHHCCILRGGDAGLVGAWLHTLALFMPDAALAMACVECGDTPAALVPDLTLQGTTCSLAEVMAAVPFFRRPPVVLDVTRRLDEACHLFPLLTLLRFDECRRAVLGGERAEWTADFRQKSPNRAGSPLVVGVLQKLRCVCMGETTLPSPTPSGSFSSLAAASHAEAHALERGHSLGRLICHASRAHSVWADGGEWRVRLLIAHWRFGVQMRAMELTVAERHPAGASARRGTGGGNASEEAVAPVWLSHGRMPTMHAADRRVLEVVVAALTPLQEVKEQREREAILELFTF